MVSLSKLQGGGGGGGGGLSYRQFAALDDADEAQTLDKVSKKVSLRIQQARLVRKLNQKQVAKMINERPAVVSMSLQAAHLLVLFSILILAG